MTKHRIIILNKQPKIKQLAARPLGKKTGKCSTPNCNGEGNTRGSKYGYTNHTSVKYCPNIIKTCVSIIKKEKIHLESTEIDSISLKKAKGKELLENMPSLDLLKKVDDLNVQIRSLENEKRLGNVI